MYSVFIWLSAASALCRYGSFWRGLENKEYPRGRKSIRDSLKLGLGLRSAPGPSGHAHCARASSKAKLSRTWQWAPSGWAPMFPSEQWCYHLSILSRLCTRWDLSNDYRPNSRPPTERQEDAEKAPAEAIYLQTEIWINWNDYVHIHMTICYHVKGVAPMR